jgi:hypothetical protein
MNTDVYLSVGRGYTDAYRSFVEEFDRHLKAVGLTPQTVGRNYYKNQEPLEAIADCMRECRGAVVLAFERVRIAEGVEMPGGGANEITLRGASVPTVWNQIEAAMAYTLGLPLLVVVQEGLRPEGLLQHGYKWYVVTEPFDSSLFSKPAFTGVLADWKNQIESTPSTRGSGADADLGSIGVGRLISMLKLGQLWATVGAIAGLVSGAAYVGYKVGTLHEPAHEVRTTASPAPPADTGSHRPR